VGQERPHALQKRSLEVGQPELQTASGNPFPSNPDRDRLTQITAASELRSMAGIRPSCHPTIVPGILEKPGRSFSLVGRRASEPRDELPPSSDELPSRVSLPAWASGGAEPGGPAYTLIAQ
jgi:hypothetical protein